MDRQHTDRWTDNIQTERQSETDKQSQTTRHSNKPKDIQSGRQKARRSGKEADIQIPIGGKKDRPYQIDSRVRGKFSYPFPFRHALH